MSSQSSEEKFRELIEDLGKPTLRGIRRCPKCGTLNGTRGISCKNKNCDVVFKEREKKKGHSAESVKIITGSNVQVYSVRLRDRGPDYRGFVQLPLVQDMEGNAPEHVDPVVLETAAKCYVDNCNRSLQGSTQNSCQHIKSAVTCVDEAIPLTLKNSVLNSLQVPSEMKQDIWLLATETSGPLVQRVTKNIMVVKCKPYSKHPLGFLHFAFFETSRNRTQPERKFQCSCRLFKLKSGASASLKDESSKRCVHFYACICAFASDEQLAEEFAYYINLDDFNSTKTVDLMVTINPDLSTNLDEFTSDVVTTVTKESVIEEQLVTAGLKDVDDCTNVEVIVADDTILALQKGAKRMKTDVDLLMEPDPLEQASSALLNLQENTLSTVVSTVTTSTVSVPAPVVLPTKKPSTPKTTPAKSVATPKKLVGLDETAADITFLQWLASVTERINQTMHYQFDGNPDPLVFHSPQKFFECIQQRISAGCKKKRLPNFTTGFIRKDALPLGSFTKYTWYITSIFHVKQIFDTIEMPLEITRSFVENRDGTYDLYEAPKNVTNPSSVGGKTPIRPFELKTYLRVGVTSPEQKDPTPFIIEWIPDILPKSHIGELRIKFEYGHQRNGQIEIRQSQSTVTPDLEILRNEGICFSTKSVSNQ